MPEDGLPVKQRLSGNSPICCAAGKPAIDFPPVRIFHRVPGGEDSKSHRYFLAALPAL
jgi:hypothetical protein